MAEKTDAMNTKRLKVHTAAAMNEPSSSQNHSGNSSF